MVNITNALLFLKHDTSAGRRSHDHLGLVEIGEKVMGQMRRLTYRNLMTVIRRIEVKGYDFQESERLARHI